MTHSVLVFETADVRLAVATSDVVRLMPLAAVAPVPLAHPALLGLMRTNDVTNDVTSDVTSDGNINASTAATPSEHVPQVVPIFDLGAFAGLPRHTAPVSGAVVVVFPTNKGLVGLRLLKLLGTVTRYVAVDTATAPPPTWLSTLHDGAGVAIDDVDTRSATLFYFFAVDAFLAAVIRDRRAQ